MFDHRFIYWWRYCGRIRSFLRQDSKNEYKITYNKQHILLPEQTKWKKYKKVNKGCVCKDVLIYGGVRLLWNIGWDFEKGSLSLNLIGLLNMPVYNQINLEHCVLCSVWHEFTKRSPISKVSCESREENEIFAPFPLSIALATPSNSH